MLTISHWDGASLHLGCAMCLVYGTLPTSHKDVICYNVERLWGWFFILGLHMLNVWHAAIHPFL